MASKPRIKTNLWSGDKTQVMPVEMHPGKQAKVIRMKKARKRSAVRSKYASYLRNSKSSAFKKGNTNI